MKIDKIEQTVEIQVTDYDHQIKNVNFTITPIGENKAILKTNPGKTLNKLGINLGADPKEAQEVNEKIIKELGVKLLRNNSIEYCIDVPTDFKLVNNKYILKTFLKALEIHKYKNGKIDFKIEKDKWIDKTDLKGMKGYKTSRTLKLYSKYEEQGLNYLVGDLIRLELVLGTRALEQNNVDIISNIEKAKQELREFLWTMIEMLPRTMNRHSITTKILIETLLRNL